MLLLQSPSLSTVFSNARPASRRHPRVWRFRLFSYAMIVRTALHPGAETGGGQGPGPPMVPKFPLEILILIKF